VKRLVLAGGGHAHLHVLMTLVAGCWPGVEVVLVTPYRRQIYSGMVPGWMAGHYTLEQCAAALVPLARAAGVRFVEAAVTAVDAGNRVLETDGGERLDYDVLSLAVGAGLDVSALAGGARLLPLRPLESFVAGWSELLAAARPGLRLAVVGGGAGGVELALAARHRLQAMGGGSVTLVAGGGLLPGHGSAVVSRVEIALASAGVDVVPGFAIGAPQGLTMSGSGRLIAADAVLAATGVRAPAWLAAAGLALAADGFVAVGDGQRSVSHGEVFAGGDVASRVDAPHGKSGVYAVRAGPVLSDNLRRALAGEALRPYRPQRRTLYLLATGPRRAIVSWGGIAAEGAWAWRWKDWIDRRFMRQYDLPSS
jgi:pyridine nucleotide-disulfide oxidoreductase family protein